MSRTFMLPVMFAAFAILGVRAQPTVSEDAARERWEQAWNAAQESASFTPSKLTMKLVQTEIGEREGEAVEERAGRAFAAALEVERAMRLGYTYQETQARLRQTLRLEVSAGTEKGKRMAAKLAKIERTNSIGGKEKALAAKNSSDKSSEKGKNGR